MFSTLLLLGCVLAPGQAPPPAVPPPGRADWVVRPQLSPGQEFVYSGSFKEDAVGGPVQYSRSYRLETRVFVLDTPQPTIPVAVYTILRNRDARPGATSADTPAASIRLERCTIGDRGVLKAEPGVRLTVPLDGPPSVEVGAFLELPSERLAMNQTWAVAEPGRPVRIWRIVGSEAANGASCIKIVGEQKTDDWDQPQIDRIAWRRLDTIWLSPRLGIAYKVERIIEKREPARDQPTQRSVMRYDLESGIPYTGQLFEDRRQEVTQALSFAAAARPLLPAPTKNGPQLNVLANKIAFHLDREPPTPYRDAVLQVRRYVEAGRRGELPPQEISTDGPAETIVATVGEPAPDFVAPEIGQRASTSLKRWLGKPVLLVFFNPKSTTADHLLQFAKNLGASYPHEVTVLGMAMSDDVDLVREKTDPLALGFPLCNGTGLWRSYAIEATPKMVLLDATGVVRGAYLGWGNEIPIDLVTELKRWLPRK
jgi:peroxiredoxin